MDKLTVKQEKFVQGLFTGLSQREAYKRAYNAENMKDESIDRKAFDLANDVKITARLQELTDELKDRNMISVERVLNQLAKIAFADIKDMLAYKTVKTIEGEDDEGNPITGYRTVIDLKDSDEVDGSLIAEVSQNRDGFKFKRNDQMKALELIGKHLGMFTDKIEHGGNLNITIDVVDDE